MNTVNTISTTTRVSHPQAETERRFEQIILPHAASLMAAAMSLTRNTVEAEDLVQETLVRAFDRFGSFRANGTAKAWLLTILRNLFFNTYRKKQREPKLTSLESLTATPTAGHWEERIIASDQVTAHRTASTECQVIAAHEHQAVLEAVNNLSPDYRRIVVMADIQGLSYSEIADVLSVPVGTVRSRLHRGRERVRRALATWRDLDPATEKTMCLSD